MNKFLVLALVFWLLIIGQASAAPDEFITTWKTDNPGTSSSTSITIPALGNYQVDWNNDGLYINADELVVNVGPVTHDFGVVGNYTIRIKGLVHRISFNPIGIDDKEKLIALNQWGTNNWATMENMFVGAKNLEVLATDVPNLSSVTSLNGMFLRAELANPNTTNWDVSTIVVMANMFNGAVSANPNTADWDVSLVIDMRNMFADTDVANPDTSQWNVSSVKLMDSMFSNAIAAQPDTSNWATVNVLGMSEMFRNASEANPDTSGWNTSLVGSMRSMFEGAVNATPDTSGWNTGNVMNMSLMFSGATLANPDTSMWNTSKVNIMAEMFVDAISAKPNTSMWDTGMVINMARMFKGAVNANPDTSMWNTSSVVDMIFMFNGATNAKPNTSGWNTSNVEFLFGMFRDAINANPETSGWNTSKVSTMSSMFEGAILANPNTNGWDISSVKFMTNMFKGVTLSVVDYDAILTGFSSQVVQTGVNFHGGNSKYCAIAAHDSLTNAGTNNWSINDAGQDFCQPAYASIPATPTVLNFTTVSQGSLADTQTILINNDNGNVGFTLMGSCAISGANSAQFNVVSSNPFSVDMGAAAATVSVACSTATSGVFTASLDCSHNGGGGGAPSAASYPLSCTVNAAAAVIIPSSNWFSIMLLSLIVGLIGNIQFRTFI